ncbi:hypothetical protein pb186bvf_011060 [Paramecium bursaria]
MNWTSPHHPVKLEQNEDNSFEEEIDRLRQQKEMQSKLKQYQQAIVKHNKKVEKQRQQIINEILPKQKNVQLAYDYDGSYMIAKQKPDTKPQFKAPTLQVLQVDTVFQPQQQQQLHQVQIIEQPKKQAQQNNHKQAKTLPPTIQFENTQKPFENFVPNQGVKLIYQTQTQEVVQQGESKQKWPRMTRQEFKALQQNENFKQNQDYRKSIVETQIIQPQTDKQRQMIQEKQSEKQSIDFGPLQNSLTLKSDATKRTSKIKIADQILLNHLLS